jgi:hypothetical protein
VSAGVAERLGEPFDQARVLFVESVEPGADGLADGALDAPHQQIALDSWRARHFDDHAQLLDLVGPLAQPAFTITVGALRSIVPLRQLLVVDVNACKLWALGGSRFSHPRPAPRAVTRLRQGIGPPAVAIDCGCGRFLPS